MRPTLSTHLLAFALLLSSGWGARAELKVGATRDEVVEALGEPEAQVSRRGREILYYGEDSVELALGVVVKVDPDLTRRLQAVSEKTGPASGAPAATVAPPTTAPVTASSTPTVRKISEGGARINLNRLLVPGNITVVDFYADWCGPCRLMAPHLEKLARDNPEVFLLKIDIVKWGTEVTKQFGIRSIPNVRVFNRNGKEIGTGTSDFGLVRQRVNQAK